MVKVCDMPPPPAPSAKLRRSFQVLSAGGGPSEPLGRDVPPTAVTKGWDAGSDTARLRFSRTSPPFVSSVIHTKSREPEPSLTSCPTVSPPVTVLVWRLAVAASELFDVLIVARTSPGKLRPCSTASISLPSGDRPMAWTTAAPSRPLTAGLPVEMVAMTACEVRLTTEMPPAPPPLATYRPPALVSTARATGSVPTVTLLGVEPQEDCVVALQVVWLKYATRPLLPSAT